MQYVKWCRLTDVPEEDYQSIPYPHPYLLIWMECKRHTDSMTGTYAYPEPEKGWLDQDADLLLGFEVLDERHAARESERERREQLKAQAAETFLGQ